VKDRARDSRRPGAVRSPAGHASLFPAGYDESRARFREAGGAAAARHGGTCRAVAIPSRTDADLTIDYVHLTGEGSRLLVVESGIHGPESYAGAAVQALLLRDHADRMLERGIDLVLIHALNPYGFRHGRRVDDANVNLNRNFCVDPSVYGREAPDYAAMRWILEPDGAPRSFRRDSRLIQLRLLRALLASGFDFRLVRAAMNQGQYRYPRGLSYGGSEARPQVRFLAEEIGSILGARRRPVLFLDIHTGLGRRGLLHIMPGTTAPPGAAGKAAALFGSLDGVEITPVSAPGFYAATGEVNDFVPALAAAPGEVLALTLEYGTVGIGLRAQLASAALLVLEGQAHFAGDVDPAVHAEIRARFLELFNPADPAWRDAVLRAAGGVLLRIEERF
jgi:hypothetical protein